MKSSKNNKSAVWRGALTFLLGMAVFFACSCDDHSKGVQEVNLNKQGGGALSREDYPHELGTFEGLDADTEWQILVKCYYDFQKIYSSNHSINLFRINGYYGTYNDYIMVTTQSPLFIPGVVRPPYIFADILFWAPPWAWKNGQFYDLLELYDSGILSYSDIESIALRYYPEDFDESYWRIK